LCSGLVLAWILLVAVFYFFFVSHGGFPTRGQTSNSYPLTR